MSTLDARTLDMRDAAAGADANIPADCRLFCCTGKCAMYQVRDCAMSRLAETKDGRLTYCTSETGPAGYCRCGHVAHQQDGETIQDFLDRISDTVGVGQSLMYPPEIRALNDAIMYLNSVLEAHQAKLTVRSIGGYASYDLTWNATLEIESIERIEPQIKEWIAAVGRRHSVCVSTRKTSSRKIRGYRP